MIPLYAKVAVLLAIVTMMLVRAPHIRRSTRVSIGTSYETKTDKILVALVGTGLLLPMIWLTTPILAFADRPFLVYRFLAGSPCFAVGLWLLHRSHADLGINWSNTLELRDAHRLVTGGIYRTLRHPMYLALLLYGLGQALVLPNWFAGPSFLVAFVLLIAVRLGAEEAMMLSEFGDEFRAYASRTKRLIPGIW